MTSFVVDRQGAKDAQGDAPYVLNIRVSSGYTMIGSKNYEITLNFLCTSSDDQPLKLVESQSQLTQWTAQIGETKAIVMPTYSICFEEMLVSGFDFSFFEGSEEIADAADWLAVDSTGNLNLTPTCTEFVNYLGVY